MLRLRLRHHRGDRKPDCRHEQRGDDRTGDEEVPEAATLKVTFQILPILYANQAGQGAAQNGKNIDLGLLLAHSEPDIRTVRASDSHPQGSETYPLHPSLSTANAKPGRQQHAGKLRNNPALVNAVQPPRVPWLPGRIAIPSDISVSLPSCSGRHLLLSHDSIAGMT